MQPPDMMWCVCSKHMVLISLMPLEALPVVEIISMTWMLLHMQASIGGFSCSWSQGLCCDLNAGSVWLTVLPAKLTPCSSVQLGVPLILKFSTA